MEIIKYCHYRQLGSVGRKIIRYIEPLNVGNSEEYEEFLL